VKPSPDWRHLPQLVLAASLLVCFGVWRWAESILVPFNTAAAYDKSVPIGNNSDLYPHWLASHELLLHGRDPYSAAVTREIQIGFYGRPLAPLSPTDPIDQVAFAYPLYVVFLLAPTMTLPFHTAMEAFRWLSLFAISCSVPLWMYAIGFRSRRFLVLSAMVLAISNVSAVQEFHMQNLTALVLLLLAAAAAATTRGWLMLGGFLLALSTIKPQLAGPFVLFFMLWSMADWAQRKLLLYSFSTSLLALVLAAESLSSGWMARFWQAVRTYQAYGADPSILRVLLPAWLALSVEAALVGLLVLFCWRWRKASAGSEYFGWALAWVATVTMAVLPKLAAYNQIVVIPALLVLLAHRRKIWQAGLFPRALTKSAFICLMWPWATALILSIGTLLIPAIRLRAAVQLPNYTSLALSPITLLAVVVTTLAFSNVR
jgi:hypothetical protein